MPGLTRRLPRLERVESPPPRDPLTTIHSYAMTMIAIVLFTLIVNITLVSQVQHFAAQHRLFNQLRLALAQGSVPLGQLDINNHVTKPGTPIALLTIPEIGVREVVVEGSASQQTKLGIGHRPDTSLPGQPGRSILMGRAAAYGGPFGSIDKLKSGDTFTVVTGQGTSTYRVIGVQNGDVKLPDPGSAGGQLTLMTAAGSPFFPHGVLEVNAELVSKPFPRPPIAFGEGVIPHEDDALASDPGRLFSLSWLLELLVLMTAAAVWAWKRWSHPATWVVFVPILAATGLLCADRICDLLPNLL